MNKNKGRMLKAVGVIGALATGAFAEPATLYGQQLSIDTTPVMTTAGVVIVAIASIWAIKKVVKLANRS